MKYSLIDRISERAMSTADRGAAEGRTGRIVAGRAAARVAAKVAAGVAARVAAKVAAVALAILLLAGLALPDLSSWARTEEQTPVRVLLDWAPNTNHTGIYVALDKGYYAEEGLDVEVLEPAAAGTTEAVVGSGKADFGISFQEAVTYARLSGVPIRSIAAVIQHNTSGFASMASRGIETPTDFEGKRYGGWESPMESAIIGALMRSVGADVEKVQFVNIGIGDLLTFLQRDMDFVWIFCGWDGIEAELRGLDLNVLMFSDYTHAVPDWYTPVIITSEGMIEKDPDKVARFMRATSKGYQSAIADPDGAAAILLRYAPELKAELVQASQRWLAPRYQDGAARWGEQKFEVWDEFADWMYREGLVDSRLDAGAAFTNEFLP
jgi:ABC-type nitrate/sulfonate/bicarbonate transport system substrate-binding protein